MHQQIGNLSGKLDMLIEAVRRSEEKSDVSRSSMQRSMDSMSARVTEVESKVRDIHGDVQEMKPTVDEVKAMKQKGMGALAVVGIAASMIGFVVATYFTTFADWVMKR